MGGLSSKIIDNKIIELNLQFANKDTKSFDSTLEKYKQIVNKDGVYSVNIDINKFGEFVNNKISNIEGSRNIIEKFTEKLIAPSFTKFVIKNSYDNKYLKSYSQTGKTPGWTTTSTKTDAQHFVIKTIGSNKYISDIDNTQFLRFFGNTMFVPKAQLKGLSTGQLGDKINSKNFSLTNGSTVGSYGFIFQNSSGVKQGINLTAEVIKPVVIKPAVIKPVVATKVILPKIAPKVNFDKVNKKSVGALMMGSIYGFYSTTQINKDTNMKDVDILIPKILLTKDYKIFLDFIFNVYLSNLYKITNQKEIDSRSREKFNEVKTFIYLVFSKINKKNNPEVFFHNLLGMLVRGSVLLILMSQVKMDDTAKTKLMSKLILNELLFFVPDDNCNFKTEINDFLKFDPTLCKIKKIIEDKKISKCEPCKKINDLNSDEISKYCPKNEEETIKESNIVYWQTGSIIITGLFLVILYLYLSKK